MTDYKDDDLLDYKETGLVMGFTEKTAVNGIKRLMREHNFPHVIVSGNNIKFRYKDTMDYLKQRTVNAVKSPTAKDDSNAEQSNGSGLSTLQLELEIKKYELEATNAESKQRIKLAELNIASMEEFQRLREETNASKTSLDIAIASNESKKLLLDELMSKYNELLLNLNNAVKSQESISQSANDKLSLANSKMDNYNALQEKKCNDCLRRDKNKCDKCGYKLFANSNLKKYNKWQDKIHS